jgi:dTDP-4-amino-4,6-dideoxygalactose transaminase
MGLSDHYPYGRYALAEALRRAGVGRGTAVLMPAVHCRVMIDPALHLGADMIFYTVLRRLGPDLSQLQLLVQEPRVRALVLPHYFGFPNEVAVVAALCRAHGVALIEDCSHAYYGAVGDRMLGTFGAYSFTSVWKFLPTPDGALLRDNSGAASGGRAPAGLDAELRGLSKVLCPTDGSRRHRSSRPEPRSTYNPALACRSALLTSRWIARTAAHGRITESRRAHYQRWLNGLEGTSGVTPLFPVLPDGVVPYVFPIVAGDPARTFATLRNAGVPIWRWEDIAASAVEACTLANEYRSSLLQLPCHQDLSNDDLDWLIGEVRRAAEGTGGA